MRRTILLAAFAFALCASAELRADPNDEQAARALFKEGIALHGKAEYAAALEKFYAAYARWKNPKILANIGTAAWELGRFVEAADAYDQFLAQAPQNDPSRAEVERAREEVLRKVGTLQVLFDGNGTVTLDDKPVDPAKLAQMRVTPGYHKVGLASNTGSRVAHGVDVAAGAVVQVDLRQGQPRSIVLSNTAATQSTSQSQSAPAAASPSRGKIEPLPWIIGGVGVAGLVASGVLFSMRGDSIENLEEDCIGDVCPKRSQGDIDTANRLGTFSLVALGVGLGCIGTATYMLTIGKSEPEKTPKEPTTELGLSVGPGGANGRVRVRF
jgi:hypothetical protein